jgi:hypothetical protein
VVFLDSAPRDCSACTTSSPALHARLQISRSCAYAPRRYDSNACHAKEVQRFYLSTILDDYSRYIIA